MSKLDWLTQEIDGLKEQGLYNRIRTIGSAQGAWLTVDGKNVLNFCSNNYLGLANHPKIVEAAKEATKKYGVGPAAVRSIAGTMDLHVQLEQAPCQVQGRRRRDYLPIRFHCESRNHLCSCRQGRCDFFGSIESRVHH
jgi:glycine C-acetyltransferase